MNKPTLKSASGRVRYTSADGYMSEVSFSSKITGEPPQETILGVVYEAVRVASLFGYGQEALREAEQAKAAVDKHPEMFADTPPVQE